MIIMNLIIVIGFLIFFIITRKYQEKEIVNMPKELKLLYPMSLFILKNCDIYRKILEKGKVSENLKAIEVGANQKEVKLLYDCKKTAIVILIIFACNTVALLIGAFAETKNVIENGYYIKRPSPGEGSVIADFDMEIEDKKNTKTNIDLDVFERRYTKEELKEEIKEACDYIDKTLPRNNSSLDEIRTPLYFTKKIPDSEIKVKWEVGDSSVIDENGIILKEDIPIEGVVISLKAILEYYDTSSEYQCYVRVLPQVLTEEERLVKNGINAINGSAKEELTKNKIKLPKEIENHKLLYSVEKRDDSIKWILVGITLAIVIFIAMDKELDESKKKRDTQMYIDYPEIINKFVLLVGAGMTVKGAWIKISEDYINKKERREKVKLNKKKIKNKKVKGNETLEVSKEKQRYAYEEMKVTMNELCNGVTETKAFENFGQRVKLMPYLRFSTLLSQNVKKGSKGLLELLEFEAVEAFQERKELAKRLGEEAGTKLLAPMAMMLMIVIVIIVVPAFCSM